MDLPENQRWYLRKHEDNIVFGPLAFEQLARWASTAQIAPHDCISTDQLTWMKAPMLPQLGMDWLVEVTTERYYGPTTLGAIQEFIYLGEIDGENFIINACDGTRRQILELPGLEIPVEPGEGEVDSAEPAAVDEPAPTGISMALQDRIHDLEQSLLEERRAFEEAEERYRELERRNRELEDKLASLGSP
jgi:hypothetical protein